MESRLQRGLIMGGMMVSAFAGGAAFLWLAGGSGAHAAAGQRTVRELRVQSLVIVDGEGRERVRLGEVGKATGVAVFDQAGAARILLGADAKSGAALTINGPDGKERIGLGADGDGPGLALNAGDAADRLTLAATEDGRRAGLTLGAGKGRPGLSLSAGPDGAGLSLRDGAGAERAGAGVTTLGGGALTLHDEAGSLLWRAPRPADEAPAAAAPTPPTKPAARPGGKP